MTTQQQLEQGQRLYQEKRYAEAVPLLQSALQAAGGVEEAWQQLVLAAAWSEQHDLAVELGKEALHHYPRSGWLWRQLGSELTKCERLDEAEKALANAITFEPRSDWVWRYSAELYKKRNNAAKRIEALERLCALDKASEHDLNALGILYHDERDFGKAVEWYRLSFKAGGGMAPLFNMGLVFSNPEVSQDADAADAYRRALVIVPGEKAARVRLEATREKLVPLAARVAEAGMSLVGPSEYYQYYLSPFEAFAIDDIEGPDQLDAKTIQRAKKRLLSEIELNDGKVAWLGDYTVDRSRALALENELLDEKKRVFHWEVFENKPLLRFLTRGEITHFLYSDAYFPESTLQLLDEEPGFRAFLSEPFARQYDVVLGRAIERRCLPVIEALFDGRRWVLPEHDDLCFKSATRHVAELLELVSDKRRRGEARKVTLPEVNETLERDAVAEIFNLLPAPFRTQQAAVVGEIRSLAVTCYNEHSDSDLSRAILSLCKRFQFKSVELTKRLDDDFNTIERLITEERKYETCLQQGRRSFHITKEGIRDGDRFFPAGTVGSLRWGITVNHIGYSKQYDYVFAVRNDAGAEISLSWSITGDENAAAQTKHFNGLVEAAFHYLAPTVLETVQKQLRGGGSLVIGSCTLSSQGVAFLTPGFLFAKQRFLPWSDVSVELASGEMLVSSHSSPSIKTSVGIKENDNAVLLPIIQTLLTAGKQRG